MSAVHFEMDTLSIEELTDFHKKERKELQAKIMQLKKSVPKGDKKRLKDIQTQVGEMEKEFEDKCRLALKECEARAVVEEAEPIPGGNDGEAVHKVSKAEKRREKKLLQVRELEARLREQAKEDIHMPRAIEQRKLLEKLEKDNLRIHEVPSDGNCLFSAVSHQLEKTDNPLTTDAVRKLAAKHLREHRDDFEAFICDDFDVYCNGIESDASCWGGQIELRALSNELKCQITVYQAEGPNIEFGDNVTPHLRITYHRHLIASGEHYNSVISSPAKQDEN